MPNKESLSELEGYDLERLLTALFPDIPGNPFAGIDNELEGLSKLLQTATEERKELQTAIASIPEFPRAEFAALVAIVRAVSKQVQNVDDLVIRAAANDDMWRDFARDELDDIKSRTFGILFLQIIKTLKFILGLLPKTRIAIYVLVIVTLLVNYLDGKAISFSDVEQAVQNTGLKRLLDDALGWLDERIGSLLGDVELITESVRDIFSEQANAFAELVRTVQSAQQQLSSVTEGASFATAQEVAAGELGSVLNRLLDELNLASNARDIVAAVMFEATLQIRDIPSLVRRIL